jgi:hypothetical protein
MLCATWETSITFNRFFGIGQIEERELPQKAQEAPRGFL